MSKIDLTDLLCRAYQTLYTIKYFLIKCEVLALIRQRFFKVNKMKDLFENVEVANILS